MRFLVNPERAIRKRLDRALAASDKGDVAEAARLYEEVATEAAALRGPDDPVALTAREDAAAEYLQLGEAECAHAFLVDLIPEMEAAPSLGPDNRYTIHARLNLAATYGEAGDYAKAQDLLRLEVERAERALGPHDETTFDARESLANANRALVNPELDRLLALSFSADGASVDRAVWETHLARAAEGIQKCDTYRSKRLIRFRDRSEEGSAEWLVEEAPRVTFVSGKRFTRRRKATSTTSGS
jgi:tetratricopeptide (TPR) repeat protein